MKLTVERLFSDPPLTGTLPTSLKFSPDGRFVAFLRVADDDRERMDLWRFRIDSGVSECWINATELVDPTATQSAAEKAERERKRQFARGIVSYSFSPDGRYLLIPADGAGYLFELASGALTRFTPRSSRQTDFRFSPKGSFVSFVRDDDLYRYEIASGIETAVTSDGGCGVSNGRAEFIAAEEMHRFEGHWWSPDETYLAYARVNERTIEVTRRFEIDADAVNVLEQHYPYAGEANAAVALRVQHLASGRVTEIGFRHAPDDYLARVCWAGDRIAAQSQSRDQQRLVLDYFEPATGNRHSMLTERSDTWIELHDNFRHLDTDRFLWTSDRDGSSQLYVYDQGETRQLTRGPGRVNQVVHADPHRVLFTGWFETPAEQHLYVVPTVLADPGSPPAALTTQSGWHEVVVAEDGRRFIDRFTALDNPGEVRIGAVAQEGPTILARESIGPDHPYHAYLSDHAAVTLGRLQAADGQWLHYRLTRPPAALAPSGGFPVIVYVYGGPGVQRVRNEWPPLLLQLFAHHGYAVFELDNRGSGNRERRFQSPIYCRLGAVEVADQIAGADFLKTLDWVDGSKIGVFGHSYGGYMTIMCLATAPRIFTAGVAVAPVTDWRLYDTHYTERYLKTPAANVDGYEQSSVFPHLDDFSASLLLIHGMADDNVLFTHSTKLYKALQSRNVPFEMMVYPGSKHALQERDVSIHRFNLILDFFGRKL